MSTGDWDLALKSSIDPCGSDLTLKLSYVPRARMVGVTPEGGDAVVTAAEAASARYNPQWGTLLDQLWVR